MTANDRPLAPYAATESASRGRRHREAPASYRGEFQRDRDRIIHSTAFRRLVYKTQVFVNHEGDLYRTRLTHSLEVAQVARTAARALNLNEALVEAISLAHDLGHTPFGHAGQDTLNACMRDYGGFEHNLQSLRVVDELETKYADFTGLNLMFETREGILKHCSAKNARALGEVGRRFLERGQPGLEAQIANLADAIAYNHHDVDDGYRARLLTMEQLAAQPLFGPAYREVAARYPDLEDRRFIYEIIRRMIGRTVDDLIETTRANLEAAKPGDIDEVRAQSAPLVAFSDEVQREHREMKRFLFDNLYKHDKVLRTTGEAQRMIEVLFERYMSAPREMPDEFSRAALAGDESRRARVVADYIAGMTDRYAIAEHQRAPTTRRYAARGRRDARMRGLPPGARFVTDNNIAARDRLIFALDVPDCERARALVDTLGDAVRFYKIGLELMMTGEYFDLLAWLLERDKKVFADLKFFDIPATVGAAVRQLRDRGASFVTVHGNQSIMEAAAENKGDTLKVLGVTVLTSLDRGDLDDLGFDCDVEALVLSRARRALEAGCDGVISSGLEVPKLREHVASRLLVVTPGIRPVDNKPEEDQKRVVSVEQAFANGADHIVVGRPIRDAANPRAAAEGIQSTIARIFA